VSSAQRYVLALSRILVAVIFLLNGLGIINQAIAARQMNRSARRHSRSKPTIEGGRGGDHENARQLGRNPGG
jgi:hypothetical protein